jgi:hypothetical protein
LKRLECIESAKSTSFDVKKSESFNSLHTKKLKRLKFPSQSLNLAKTPADDTRMMKKKRNPLARSCVFQ